MEFLLNAMDFVIHLDTHMGELIEGLGNWVYLLLFVVVFAETGLVVTPFLPGDSLLFIVGTFAALDCLNVSGAFLVLVSSAIIGDAVNYAVGKYFGNRMMSRGSGRLFKKEYVAETHRFFERHGGKTIILARFVPIIRTFAPFVAGIGGMDYRKFVAYNISGGLLWVAIFLFGGYYFGNIPLVKDNFLIAVGGMVLVSALPILFGFSGRARNPKVQ